MISVREKFLTMNIEHTFSNTSHTIEQHLIYLSKKNETHFKRAVILNTKLIKLLFLSKKYTRDFF